jgi:hypothetical protein
MTHILLMALVGILCAAAVPASMILMAGTGLSEAVTFTVAGRPFVFRSLFRRASAAAPPATIPVTAFSFATPQIAAAAFVISIAVSGHLVGQLDSKTTSSSTAFSCS